MNIGSSIACILVSSFGFYNLGNTIGALKVYNQQQQLLQNNGGDDVVVLQQQQPISSPTNDESSSSSYSTSSPPTRIKPRSSFPIWKDDDDDDESNQQQLLREEEEETIKRIELLVHPAMLTHEDSERVIICSQREEHAERLTNELRKHKSLEKWYVVDSTSKEEFILNKLLNTKKKRGVDVVLIEEGDDNDER